MSKGGTRDGVSLTTMQQEPRSGFGSATRNRDTEKADIHNRVDEAAGDIDGRDPPRRFEDLSGSDGVPFKYVPLDTKDIAVIETDGRHLLYRKEGLGIVVIVARSKLRRHLMKEPWGDTEPALEGFANACCR